MMSPAREAGLFWPATVRMLLSSAVFVVAYGACNQITAQRANVGTLAFEWERHIPFIAEMVVPYWSLDLFFCGVFFLCASRVELDLLTRRLITVTLASSAFFLLLPLQLAFARPEPEGWTAPLFRLLYLNDQPYNLVPSLHISLRSLVWTFYGAHLRGRLRVAAKVWFVLIGASTLLVWQHHVIDVASGFVMAWMIAVVVKDPRQPGTVNRSWRLACRYGLLALVLALLAFFWIGLAWPAVGLGIVALAYASGRSRLFGKENGTLSPAAEWVLLPFLMLARLVQLRWSRRQPALHEVTPGVWFGRKPSARQASTLLAQGPLAVLDLTAESNAPATLREQACYLNLPLLDLLPPKPAHIDAAVSFLAAHADKRALVFCQLGLQRSATVAAHWLVHSGAEPDLLAAVRRVRQFEPLAVVSQGRELAHPVGGACDPTTTP